VDGPVSERLGERVVDEAVLVDERETREARADHRYVKVVAPARAVDDLDVLGVRERASSRVWSRSLTARRYRKRPGPLVHVQVDPDEDQRPEDDGQDGGEKPLQRVDVLEVVVSGRDDRPTTR
jgi:hypothetical protein